MNPYVVLGAIAGGASVYFLVNWVTARRAMREMTRIERAQAQQAEEERRKHRRAPKKVFTDALADSGYHSDPAPVVIGIAFAYLTLAVGLQMMGFASLIAAAVALPVLAAIAFLGRTIWQNKRALKFAYQLKQLFDLLAGQLEAGYGTQRALETVVPALPDPLRTEFQQALDSTRAGRNLIEALKEVHVRFPSRGFDLFIAALEIDREQGGSLSKTLKKAAEMLGREFNLQQQADTKLVQSKQTFYIVAAIMLGACGMLLMTADGESRDVYFSVFGITVLAVLAGWAALAFHYGLRLFSSAKGDL